MLEKCLLFLSSVNNNKLCYYLPINKNLLIDYILLEQYENNATYTTNMSKTTDDKINQKDTYNKTQDEHNRFF